MSATATLTLVDGVRIVVPDSLDLVTPYVLREQEDWFEDEIKFLRRMIAPGQRVIDIGANYGAYSLCLARAVGPAGQVWAFEPATATAAHLANSIAANGFTQITLERSALSSAPGVARLNLEANSEMNAIVRGAGAGTTESVNVVSLDDRQRKYDWHDIDFMKIDAEGEEGNILTGGERFFTECSPLVQYEVKAGNDLHLELVSRFAALGYASYRLVPGLDALIPFDPRVPADPFLLNLFCCKPMRAEQLEAAGFLVSSLVTVHANEPYGWRHTLAPLPYGARLADVWAATMSRGQSDGVASALALHALSRDMTQPVAVRFAALDMGITRLNALCSPQPAYLRLASLARMAREHGARALAMNALSHLSNNIIASKRIEAEEPFLAPDARFDTLACGDVIGNWVLAGVLEALERVSGFSSYYAGASGLPRLEMIAELGFGSAEMERRLRMVRTRFKRAPRT